MTRIFFKLDTTRFELRTLLLNVTMIWHDLRGRLKGILRHRCMGRQELYRVWRIVGLKVSLALLATREVALFTGHNPAWMDNIKDDQGNQHGQSVEDVLINLVVWYRAVQTL